MSEIIFGICCFIAGGLLPWGIIIGRATNTLQAKVMAELTRLSDGIDGKGG